MMRFVQRIIYTASKLHLLGGVAGKEMKNMFRMFRASNESN
jgi:hypothetical protein